MRKNRLRALAQGGAPILNAWLAIPSAYSAEVMGHQGYDSVTVDLQHGMIGFDAAVPMLQALSSTPAVMIVISQSMSPVLAMVRQAPAGTETVSHAPSGSSTSCPGAFSVTAHAPL